MLRSEFQEPRKQLWNLFEEALRAPSQRIQTGILTQIEQDAAAIVNRGLSARSFWPADLLHNGLRFVVNGMVGANAWAQQVEKGASKNTITAIGQHLNYLDAGRVIAMELSNSDTMVRLICKHMTVAEQKSLGISTSITGFFGEPKRE